MTGAELKTLREVLGLALAWCCDYFKVAERSWRFWENDGGNIPEEIISELNNLVFLMERAATESTNLVLDKGLKQCVLFRYKTDIELWRARPDMKQFKLPVTYHAKILYLTKKKLEENNISCEILYKA